MYISLVGFLYVSKVLTLLMVMAKGKLDYDFSSWYNLRLKFGKITSGFTLTEQWEAGNYPSEWRWCSVSLIVSVPFSFKI